MGFIKTNRIVKIPISYLLSYELSFVIRILSFYNFSVA